MPKEKKHTEGVAYILRKFPVLSETFILNEILNLEARGIRVHIFSLERPNDPRFHEDLPKLKANIQYLPRPEKIQTLWSHQVRSAKRFGKSYYRALWYALRRVSPALLWRVFQGAYVANHARRLKVTHLHSHFANRPTSVAFFAAMIMNIPYSFTAHAADIFRTRMDQNALAQKIRFAKFVVTVSEFNKKFLSELAAGCPEKIIRIYNGIDLQRFVPNGILAQKPFTILCVSRLVEKKGIAVLIEACKMLRDRKVEFQCWLVGGGELEGQLRAQIKASGLESCVKLLGPHSQFEVLTRYHGAHLYALPCVVSSDGNRDGLPVSIVEALACGLPVVSTPMTGIPEVIRNGENGLLVPVGDADALSKAVESVIRDPGLHTRLKSQARSSVESLFDQEKTSNTLVRLFAAEETPAKPGVSGAVPARGDITRAGGHSKQWPLTPKNR